MDLSPSESFTWTLRVRHVGDSEAAAYARNNTFTVGQPASFRQTDPHPSAVEYLLGALGADLTNGFYLCASKLGIHVDALEMSLSGRLGNALVYLGVIGEDGDPGFDDIAGVFYVRADSGEELISRAWQTTLDRSPVANTLKHGVTISIELRIVD